MWNEQDECNDHQKDVPSADVAPSSPRRSATRVVESVEALAAPGRLSGEIQPTMPRSPRSPSGPVSSVSALDLPLG